MAAKHLAPRNCRTAGNQNGHGNSSLRSVAARFSAKMTPDARSVRNLTRQRFSRKVTTLGANLLFDPRSRSDVWIVAIDTLLTFRAGRSLRTASRVRWLTGAELRLHWPETVARPYNGAGRNRAADGRR